MGFQENLNEQFLTFMENGNEQSKHQAEINNLQDELNKEQNVITAKQIKHNLQFSMLNQQQDGINDLLNRQITSLRKLITAILAGSIVFVILAVMCVATIHRRVDVIEEANIKAFSEQHQRIDNNKQNIEFHDERLNLFLNKVDADN